MALKPSKLSLQYAGVFQKRMTFTATISRGDGMSSSVKH